MFWQDDDKQEIEVTDDVVDLLFHIECRTLPVDHAYDLSQALLRVTPWLTDDERIGVHTVHLAGSQNGWERPDPALGQTLQLSRRTKLTIRVPREHMDRLQSELVGATLDIAGNPLTIGAAKTRTLSRQGTIFARYVVLEAGEDQDEHRFLSRAADRLTAREIRMRKALCGKTALLQTPDGPIATRSLMLADLKPEESLRLQQEGLGPLRHMGCGIFIPHKGIEAVKKSVEDD